MIRHGSADQDSLIECQDMAETEGMMETEEMVEAEGDHQEWQELEGTQAIEIMEQS